jgi:hypothetical protein
VLLQLMPPNMSVGSPSPFRIVPAPSPGVGSQGGMCACTAERCIGTVTSETCSASLKHGRHYKYSQQLYVRHGARVCWHNLLHCQLARLVCACKNIVWPLLPLSHCTWQPVSSLKGVSQCAGRCQFTSTAASTLFIIRAHRLIMSFLDDHTPRSISKPSCIHISRSMQQERTLHALTSMVRRILIRQNSPHRKYAGST